MATKVGRTVAYFESLLTIKSFYALITWSCKVTWQTKIIYSQPECLWLQTWQNDNSTWWVRTYKVTSPFDHVVLRDHVANKNHHISIARVSMASKLGRMIASLDGLLPTMWDDPLITMALWDTRFTYRRRFSTQTLKLSPTSCFSFVLLLFSPYLLQKYCFSNKR